MIDGGMAGDGAVDVGEGRRRKSFWGGRNATGELALRGERLPCRGGYVRRVEWLMTHCAVT